jgi:hypothetical protein
LAFIPIRLSCSGPVHAGSPAARLLAMNHDNPTFTNVGLRMPPAKGTCPAKSTAISGLF